MQNTAYQTYLKCNLQQDRQLISFRCVHFSAQVDKKKPRMRKYNGHLSNKNVLSKADYYSLLAKNPSIIV